MSDSTISVSPAYKSYGVVRLDTTNSQVFRVTNTSADATLILGALTSTTVPFWKSGASIADSTINPAGYVDATYEYIPTALSTGDSDIVYIYSNDPNDATYELRLDGTCQQPIMTLNPTGKNFGDSTKGVYYELVTVTNTGNVDMTVGALSGFAAPYTVSSDNVSGSHIHPSDTTTYAFVVGYTPTALGLSDSTLTIPNNDATASFIANGNCEEADISVDPASWSFGVLKKNESGSKVFRITNNGNVNLILGDVGAMIFPFKASGVWPTDATIAPAAYFDCTVLYEPIALSTGSQDYIEIASNDPDTPDLHVNVDGTCQQAVVVVAPASKDYGNVVNLGTYDQTITVRNDGNVNLTVGTISGQAAPYTLVNNNVTGATIGANDTSTVVLRYQPKSCGVDAGITMTIPNSDTTQTFRVDATSTAAITLTPTSKNFGSKPNLSVNDQIVTVTNASTGDATFGAFAGFSAPYTTVADTVSGRTIAGGGSAAFTVRWSPTAYGTSDDTLTLGNNDSTQTFIANGLSQEADISVTPAYKSFGAKLVRYGTFGAPIMEYCDITCTNVGNINLKMQEITPPSNMSFFLSNDNVSRRTLIPGASGTIRVSQRPATFGDESCAIVFNSTDPDTAAYNFVVYGTGLGA